MLRTLFKYEESIEFFAYEEKDEQYTFRGNCLQRLEVNGIKVLKNKLSKLKLVLPLTQIGGNWVAEFEDSEGNHIEITLLLIILKRFGISRES